MNLSFSESAIVKINDFLAEENNPLTYLRIAVQGGGCSGFSYKFSLDTSINDDDFEIPCGSSMVKVDAMSSQYIQNATVEYEETLMGANFKINNPGVSTCSCGSSFS
jgi:iron-sulfur cluster insertion protein